MRHFEELRPFGIELDVRAAETGKGFFAETSGPAYDAARAALASAWGADTVFVATGGSIPLVSALSEAAPDAEILMFGTTDGFANIHAPNERVLLDEFEKAVLAEAEFFGRYAASFETARRDRDDRTGAIPDKPPLMQRILGAIERGGNKMPNPAILFVWLCVIVIVLSALLAWADIKVTYQVVEPPPVLVEEVVQGGSTQPSGGLPDASVQEGEYTVREETAAIQSLLSADGVRFLFTSFVANFRNFAAVAIILVVMIGVGLAEAAGLIGSLIRKLVSVSSEAMLTPIIIFIGVLSSVASDAGYLVLIPLGAAAFKSVGRNPLAGMAAAFAGVAAGFGVNFLITPLDGVLTEITNDASALVDPDRSIDLAANLYFGIASTILVTIVLTLVSVYIVERSLGKHDPALESDDESLDADKGPEVSPEADARGLRYALFATLAVLGVITLLTVFPDAPLRDPVTGDIIGDSPFMDSLIVIITIIFFAAGLAYGRGAGTIRTSDEVLASITKSWAGLASLLFLFLLIAQFIAYFNYSNMAQVAAVKLGDWLEEANIGVGVAADRVRARDDAGRPHHAGGDRQVGHPRPDLHPALPAARRRAADGARRLPRRRLAVQRGHAADGLLPADHHLRAALPKGRRHRHRRRDDAPVRRRPVRASGRSSSSPGTWSEYRLAQDPRCTSTSAGPSSSTAS